MTTLRLPQQVPSPTQDSETLRKAFQGWGTDEKAVIQVLGHRNSTQRKLIRDTYQQLYNTSLIDSLYSELSGDFGKAVILWTYDPAERDARLVNNALKSKNLSVKQLQIIVEITCANSSDHILAVRKCYCSLFQRSLEEDIIASVPKSVRKILVGLASSYRFDGAVVDLNVANDEASKLQEAIALKQLDQDVVVWILSTRNMFQLKATFESYNQQYGSSIYEDIKDCGNELLESLLKIAIRCIVSPEKHFAEVILASIKGWGTDEDSLTRALVSRAEIDLMKVRGAYFEMNETSLDNAVTDDTSGYYQAFLMALLGQ
ncbi:annexin D3 [Rutidosis leptorrhynchoides]|uniref:annexin D3 n=1 Tax=Rutidosis leptorrhynchoides TaxID=125765 RepID=UPI003A99723C